MGADKKAYSTKRAIPDLTMDTLWEQMSRKKAGGATPRSARKYRTHRKFSKCHRRSATRCKKTPGCVVARSKRGLRRPYCRKSKNCRVKKAATKGHRHRSSCRIHH